jgi:hypothetical protein
MFDINERSIFRVDPDQPIFRVYRKKWFLPILEEQQDALRNPSTWEDPFENFFMKARVVAENAEGRTEYGDLETLARDWYGQCWTKNCNTDAMWRIYSPCKDGIQVKTTVRKLFENLKTKVPPSTTPQEQFFIGGVEYLTKDPIKEMMGTVTFAEMTQDFANLLCIKRDAFEHEAEVRILFQDIENPRRGLNATLRYSLNANDIFEQIVLDPRLDVKSAQRLRRELCDAGCTIPICRSDLYEPPEFTIRLE